MLREEAVSRDIRNELKEFFERNCGGDTDLISVWEAHKCYIRGILFKWGSKMKKIRKEREEALLE